MNATGLQIEVAAVSTAWVGEKFAGTAAFADVPIFEKKDLISGGAFG